MTKNTPNDLLERLQKGECDVMQALADNLLEKSDAALVLGTVASRIWLPHGYVATLELRPIASHVCDADAIHSRWQCASRTETAPSENTENRAEHKADPYPWLGPRTHLMLQTLHADPILKNRFFAVADLLEEQKVPFHYWLLMQAIVDAGGTLFGPVFNEPY